MKFQSYPNTYVGQVHIKVTDLQKSLAFYQEIVGFDVLETDGQKAILTADGRSPLLVIEQPDLPEPKQPRTTGLYHFALLLPERKDLAKTLIHLLQSHYPLEGAADHFVSEALYLSDPDGNGIEIYTDRPDDTWKWEKGEVDMGTVALDAQGLVKEDDGKPWTGLPEETVMGHIHLHVANLAETEHFYLQGLGFERVLQYGEQALFISTGKYHHHIGLNTWNGAGAPSPSENSAGLKSFTLILPSDRALKETAERLEQMGVNLKWEAGQIITRDPSGNVILLSVN